jgi:ELWxxDGT repeat protein
VLGGSALFMGTDATHGFEPWITDGTVAGTSILKDIVAGSLGSNPTAFATAGGKVYFQDQEEPWISDGTPAGTVQLAALNPPSGSYATGFTGFNGAVFFTAYTGTNGFELLRTDGTQAGTAPLADPATAGTSPSWLSPGTDQMLYSASAPMQGFEPYRTDGTAAGTRLVIDLHPGNVGSNPVEFTPFDGSFFFQADDGTHGIELYRTDGTPGGTSLVADTNPGAPDGNPEWLTAWNGALYFRADDDVHGNELWTCAFEPASSALDAGIGGSCPSTPPSMVRVGAYCVDSTEVTNAQYAAFLTAKGSDVSGQSASCTFNTTYQPDTTCSPTLYDPVKRADYPVVCVNWCDAAAYCAWAGKHLCGSTQGGSTTSSGSAGEDQWMNACTGGGQYTYPYGNTYAAGTCVDGNYSDAATPGLRPVHEAAGCQGGFPGIFGMSGNAWEWEDWCDLGLGNPSMDTCYLRGGSFSSDSTSLTCAAYGYNTRQTTYSEFGFRCCAEVH